MDLRSPEVRTYTIRTNRFSFVDYFFCVAPGIVSQIFERVCAAQDDVKILISTIQIMACVGMRAEKIVFSIRVLVDIRVCTVADDRCCIVVVLNMSNTIFAADDSAQFLHSIGISYLYGCGRIVHFGDRLYTYWLWLPIFIL